MLPSAEPGYLRYAIRVDERLAPAPSLGIMRPYPRTLVELEELAPALVRGEGEIPGATEVRQTLLTLPTHRFVTRRDMSDIGQWLGGCEGTTIIERNSPL
jgi:hypothetical protein